MQTKKYICQQQKIQEQCKDTRKEKKHRGECRRASLTYATHYLLALTPTLWFMIPDLIISTLIISILLFYIWVNRHRVLRWVVKYHVASK